MRGAMGCTSCGERLRRAVEEAGRRGFPTPDPQELSADPPPADGKAAPAEEQRPADSRESARQAAPAVPDQPAAPKPDRRAAWFPGAELFYAPSVVTPSPKETGPPRRRVSKAQAAPEPDRVPEPPPQQTPAAPALAPRGEPPEGPAVPAAPGPAPGPAPQGPGPGRAGAPGPKRGLLQRLLSGGRAERTGGPAPAAPDPVAAACEFSVVVPSRDEGELLVRTVESILRTRDATFEVIVADDGEGETMDLHGRWPNVFQIAAPRRGPAAARNAGVEVARGRILVFLDAHVQVPPHWLSAMGEALRADPGLAAVGAAIADEARPRAVGYGMTWDEELNPRWLSRPERAVAEVPLVPSGCMAVRADAFRAAGGFNRGFRGYGYEDVEFSLRLWLLGYRLACLRDVVVSHRFRSRFPYPVDLHDNCYNLLRMAASHFNERRVAKVIGLVARRTDPGPVLARVLTDDTADDRRRWHQTRVHTDDWFMERFGIPF